MSRKLTRHAKLQAKKEEKEQAQQVAKQAKEEKSKRKTTIITTIAIIILIPLIWGFMALSSNTPYSEGQVHWHADLDIIICGTPYDITIPHDENQVHGQAFLGTPVLHMHDDKRIHIEGVIQKPEDITLGKFMDVINLNFKDDRLLDKQNGDVCGDQPGKVKLFVNNQEKSELSSYVIKDGDHYQITFEPV